MHAKKIFIYDVERSELGPLLHKLHAVASESRYDLVHDPESADLILVCSAQIDPAQCYHKDPLILAHRHKCVAYTYCDRYLPILPGVYCSPIKGLSTRIGRVASYSLISRHVQLGNPFVMCNLEECPKDLLFSFQGSSTSWVRKRLYRIEFNRLDIHIENTRKFRNWISDISSETKQRNFVDTIRRSHYALCPRGAGTNTYRLFEAMRLGVAPVLISDDFVLPSGPNWDSFLVRVREREISRLPEILEPQKHLSMQRGRLARAAWEQWFDSDKEFNELIHRASQARSASLRYEKFFLRMQLLRLARYRILVASRSYARSMVLFAYRLSGMSCPFSLRERTPEFQPEEARDDIEPRDCRTVGCSAR